MATFTFIPSVNVRQTTTPRVRTAQFGDGYQQRVADGINTRQEFWSLAFNGVTDTVAGQIDAFLVARNAVESFDWTTPDGRAIKVVCDEWNRDFSEPDVNTITATFRRVYEP